MKWGEIISLIIFTILIVSFLPTLQGSQNLESPIDKGPIWEKDYGEDEMIRIYPSSEQEYFLIREEELEILNQNGEEEWSKTFPNSVKGLPVLEDDRVYLQTGSAEENRFQLRCLDWNDGSEIWNETINDFSMSILVNQEHEIFLPHQVGGNLTKVSSEGETEWTKKYTEGAFISYGRILGNDQIVILYLYRGERDEIRSISPDGEVNWKISLEERVKGLQVEEEANTCYIFTYNEIYKVDSEGEKDIFYEIKTEKHLKTFRVKNDRIYLVQGSDEGNNTRLKSIDKDGEDLWNISIDNLDTEKEGPFISLYIPGNERIYCQYQNLSQDVKSVYRNVYQIKAFDLDGNLEWEHEYENETAHTPHVISRDGVIVTNTEDGKIYGYQGHNPESEDEDIGEIPGFSLTILLLAVVMSFVIYQKKKG